MIVFFMMFDFINYSCFTIVNIYFDVCYMFNKITYLLTYKRTIVYRDIAVTCFVHIVHGTF